MESNDPTMTTPVASETAWRSGPWERRAGPILFWLALVFLVVASGVIHRVGRGSLLELEIIALSLFVLWPVFIVEAVVRLARAASPEPWWKRLLYCLALILGPPLRLGARSYSDPARLWLPGLGWVVVDKHLRRRLERVFSVPMVVMALLVLPVLGLEYFWYDAIKEHFGWLLVLDLATSLIWLAFALELILMLAVTDHKLRYGMQNWMDVAVVALPLIDFLPILRMLRLTRVLQLQQLSNMSRLYRLRGLLFKLWRAVLLLELIQRALGQTKEKRLRRLKQLLAARMEELHDLKGEIEELEKELAAKGNKPQPVTCPGMPMVTAAPLINDEPQSVANAS